MLQQQFENYDCMPEFYSRNMYNMHNEWGNGYYGVTVTNEYSGVDSYSIGDGWIFLGIECINRNLIFKI